MLKGILRNSVAILLAAIVLIATSGFTVFKHSCQAKQSTEFSLILPDFSCAHYNQQYEGTEPSCCGEHDSQSSESCQTGNCCDTDIFLVKLNITIDLQDYNKTVVITYVDLPAENEYEIISCSEEINHIIVSNDLSPPLSGKALHIFLNQLNIPFASV